MITITNRSAGVGQIWSLPAAIERRNSDRHKRAAYQAYGWANVNETGHYT